MRSSLTESQAVPSVHASGSRPFPDYQLPPSPQPKSPTRPVLAPAEGWLPLILLTIAVYSVVYSVILAINISHNSVLWITTAFGLILGLAISKNRYFPQFVLHIAACIIGYWLALFLTSVLAYHISVLALLSTLRTIISSGFTLTETQNSNLIFLFYLSFLCFFLGYFGSWLIYRAHLPWLVAFVYMAIMLVNLNYVSKSDPSFLIIILVGSLLLLIARVQLASQLAQWKSDGLHTNEAWLQSVTTRFLRIASLFLVLILPLSWLIPIASQPAAGVAFWNGLDNAWNNISHGHLPSLTNPNALFNPYDPPSDFFGNQLTITGNVKLPNGPVLAYISSSPLQGQYLEGFSFNTFDGHTWISQGSDVSQSFPANAALPLDTPHAPSSSLMTSITIIQPPDGTKAYIFAPAQPEDFTVPVTLFSSNTGNITSTWTQTTPLRRNESYQVRSAIAAASLSELMALSLPNKNLTDGTTDANYNAVQQNNLQVPSDLSPEVLATALEWTKGAVNVYAAVTDLQEHLSNSHDFTYSVANPPVPANIDAVTWLLHTHKGYCTYYATAMTIMARLLNIPARIVNGFSAGHYDAQRKIWIVDGSDAHSWVQVYFPGAGWINFDPTPGFSLNSRATANPSPIPNPTKPPVRPTPSPTPPHNKVTVQPTPIVPPSHGNTSPAGMSFFPVGALLFLLFSLVAVAIFIARRRSNRSGLLPIASIYARLCSLGRLVGSPPARWQTPYEYTSSLGQRFPQASEALHHIADLFVREQWASPQQAPNPVEKQELERLWPRLRNALLHPSFRKKE